MAKRKYYNKTHYIIDKEKRVLILLPEWFKALQDSNNRFETYKKLGGSTIPNILLKGDPFKSEFAAFCHITRLSQPVLISKYIEAGNVLEPRVFDLLRKTLSNKNITVENYVSKDLGFDYFKNKYKFFQGVPDGYMNNNSYFEKKNELHQLKLKLYELSSQNDPEYLDLESKIYQLEEEVEKENRENGRILEIKTAGAKKYDLWERDGVDLGYRKQAQTYAYLNGNDKYSIVAVFLNEEDYLNPAALDFRTHKVKTYNFNVNPDEVADDFKIVEEWYKKYTSPEANVSPVYDPIRDATLIQYLECENEQQWAELLEEFKRTGKADPDRTIYD
ncbi:MAGa7180 family putative nuclease [Mycoplasma corogypsi]|uniref:MAGa7180 family putative nuclease n=1 Tax=Mycoplasma corogypsi TaxID=2106 RepID=UPI003872AF10